jgi:hypothetical protein
LPAPRALARVRSRGGAADAIRTAGSRKRGVGCASHTEHEG